MHWRATVLLGLFLAALALRPQIVGAGPLIPEMRDDLHLSHAVAGLFGTIPVLCMGVFALPAVWLARRLGTRSAVALAVGGIGAFGLARAFVPTGAAVVALTVPASVGMGLGNALLPAAVKERFAARPAFATGVYATGINVGSTVAAAVAVPIAHLLGGWRASLGVLSGATVVLAFVWLWSSRGEPAHVVPPGPPQRLPWRSPLVWRLVATFALMSSTFYGLNAWLPASYVERGWDETSAGELLAVLNLASIPATLLVAAVADRVPRRRYLMIGATEFLVAVLGIELLPGGGWIWAALAGVASGTAFPLVMTLPLDVARRSAAVGAVTAVMLGVGYATSATCPFVLGAVRDATGSFSAAMWVLAGTSAGLLALVSSLSAARLRTHAEPSTIVA